MTLDMDENSVLLAILGMIVLFIVGQIYPGNIIAVGAGLLGLFFVCGAWIWLSEVGLPREDEVH